MTKSRSKSNRKRSKRSKRSKSKSKSTRKVNYSINHQMDIFFVNTQKYLTSEHKGFLEKDNNNKIIKGRVSRPELEKIFWMHNVNPAWTVIEPKAGYEFELSFSQKNNEEIIKKLNIHNGPDYLIKDLILNNILK